MNSQEILENLVKLENNLQNIDTARKQVETLSNSYDATEKQLKREKPERVDMKYIVHENGYRCMDAEELKEMFEPKSKNKTYEEWMQAFCNRKYNSDFSKEMTRSVGMFLKSFE